MEPWLCGLIKERFINNSSKPQRLQADAQGAAAKPNPISPDVLACLYRELHSLTPRWWPLQWCPIYPGKELLSKALDCPNYAICEVLP